MSAQYVTQFPPDRKPQFLWTTIVVTCLLLVSAIVLAPLLRAEGHTFLSLTIYQSLSYFCHQFPERSFQLAGEKFAVCTRCTGIYFGFTASLLLYPLLRPLRRTETPHRKWLLLGAFPLFLDFALTFFGVWENTHWTRFFTGALLGSVALLYVLPGLVDLIVNRRWSSTPSEKRKQLGSITSISPEALVEAKSDYSAPHRRI
ncbi:MAG TPA: DUF2085 domain-containing protein [Pyrinomonadaceae bacterium]|nr:DUF2085 domain-containing protein [Pyrinomonadaceae bacterium]